MTRHRRFVVGLVLAALVAACGGDDGGGDDVSLEDIEPIVAVQPCDLLDADRRPSSPAPRSPSPRRSSRTTAPPRAASASPTTRSPRPAGSDIAALLEIGPGDEDDVPGGSLASSLDMGDAAAVEEEEDKVTVVYVVQTVVVIVEVAPGSGEVTPETVDEVVEFAETTEPVVTEAVTRRAVRARQPPPPSSSTTTRPRATSRSRSTATPRPELRPSGRRLHRHLRGRGRRRGVRPVPDGHLRRPGRRHLPARRHDRSPRTSHQRRRAHAPDGTTFLDRTVLEVSGVYQLVLTGDATQTGSVDVLVTSATDGEGTIEVDGATETATVEQPGAIFTLEFELAAGDGHLRRLPRRGVRRPEAGHLPPCRLIDPERHQHQRRLHRAGRHQRSSTGTRSPPAAPTRSSSTATAPRWASRRAAHVDD